jgi:hypothetical protein
VPNRRQLMQSGLAASVAALLPFGSAASRLAGNLPVVPHPELFIFDERFPDALGASQQAMHDSVRLASTRQVFTSLWYDELDLRWRRAPMIVAGATTDRTLHVLETLALDRRMRVIDRAAFGADGLVRWTIGPVARYRTRPAITGA